MLLGKPINLSSYSHQFEYIKSLPQKNRAQTFVRARSAKLCCFLSSSHQRPTRTSDEVQHARPTKNYKL